VHGVKGEEGVAYHRLMDLRESGVYLRLTGAERKKKWRLSKVVKEFERNGKWRVPQVDGILEEMDVERT
jgi:hypothetical protein